MKIKELISVIFDKVIIYKSNEEDFEDLFKGDRDSIPANILEMKVRSVGAAKKGIVDIQVF